MKQLFQYVVAFLHRSPWLKTAVTAAGGALLVHAQAGEYGPQAAGAAAAVIALWIKRPKDATTADKGVK
jgi:hypothetical protein